ncbi:hypothetical protein H6501_03680 [Candidatus Woesearchaeota archaeon]|nr:hypothetical protein [Nanoarchaeota archaeon]MCB9370671.1 hypothetical protein [Candidatus Woesearchaeota archaeon]USN43755.1 MAG: hypothetical protein H6500_05180 [Candidatus Woesearchaeota archaeon]
MVIGQTTPGMDPDELQQQYNIDNGRPWNEWGSGVFGACLRIVDPSQSLSYIVGASALSGLLFGTRDTIIDHPWISSLGTLGGLAAGVAGSHFLRENPSLVTYLQDVIMGGTAGLLISNLALEPLETVKHYGAAAVRGLMFSAGAYTLVDKGFEVAKQYL